MIRRRKAGWRSRTVLRFRLAARRATSGCATISSWQQIEHTPFMNLSICSAFTRAGVAVILFIGHFAAADVVRVACVGDSITFGYGLQQSYPATLGHWLGTNYDVRNFGVSATTLLHRGDFP